MVRIERRVTQRFKVQTPLSFHRLDPLFEAKQQSTSMNVSRRGVYFATGLDMHVGEPLELRFKIPKRISGVKMIPCRFVGRVVHVESNGTPPGLRGVGGLLLYYERDPAR
jgi:hypothetical protein